MRIHRGSFDSIKPIIGRHAVSLGTFDGVHRGHQAILQELREVASRSDLAGAVAVTFGLHPRSVISERGAPPSITNLEERIGLLAATGIDQPRRGALRTEWWHAGYGGGGVILLTCV